MGFSVLQIKTNIIKVSLINQNSLVKICSIGASKHILKFWAINDVGSRFLCYIDPLKNGTYTTPTKEIVWNGVGASLGVQFYYDSNYIYALVNRYSYSTDLYISSETANSSIISGQIMESTDVSGKTLF